jgi:hypothetical protein
MQLGIEMNLPSFFFLTQARSEIRIFARLPTNLQPPGDPMWMSMCKCLNLNRKS